MYFNVMQWQAAGSKKKCKEKCLTFGLTLTWVENNNLMRLSTQRFKDVLLFFSMILLDPGILKLKYLSN